MRRAICDRFSAVTDLPLTVLTGAWLAFPVVPLVDRATGTSTRPVRNRLPGWVFLAATGDRPAALGVRHNLELD